MPIHFRLLALSSLLALSACTDNAAPDATPSLTVSLATPQQQEVAREVVASGAVAAWEEVSIGVELSGLRVASVEVEVGSVVAQGDCTVGRAPVAGVVSARSVQPGQVVGAGGELLRLIRDGRLEWRAELAETDLMRVDVGTPVRVESAAGLVDGAVRRVSPALDVQSRTGTVYVDLPEPGALRAGMFAQGRIALGRVQVLLVPGEAVVRRDGRAYVFTVADDGRVREVGVEVGGPHGDMVEVHEGLAESDRVVARGAGFLGDGDLVRVVSEAGTDAAAPGPGTRPE